MSDSSKLCMGCMNPLNDDGTCSHCNYNSSFPYLLSYLAPKTILDDRYIVGKLLSYNGESAVYIGFDKVTGEKVSIKEYMPDTLCSREKGSANIIVNPQFNAQYKAYLQEFLDLGKTLSRMRTLSHIVPALDMFMQNNTAYVILEYVEGKTLKQLLQENAGELSWDEVKNLFPPIFTTLSLIHNAGVIHRGISLDTIIITEKQELKITGFCISAVRTANTELATELFAGYAAPEQYSSNNWQGTWTDVYAVGAVLYRILTGCMPVEALSRISNDNLIEPAAINSEIPRNISKVIMQALLLSGEMRIQTITELVTKLFEQPEYLDQNKETTQVVPVVKAKSSSSVAVREEKPQSNVPVIVGAVFIVLALLAALILLLVLILPGDETDNVSSNYTTPIQTSTITTGLQLITTPPISDEGSSQSNGNLTAYFVPDFVGGDYNRIKNNLNITSRITFEVEYNYNDNYPNGIIYYQDIDPDTVIYDVQVVKIKVSNGPEFVKVPDYDGMSKKDYLEMLDELLIKYEVEDFETNDVIEGNVVKTNLNVGDKLNVKEGEVLTVYIAVKPEVVVTDPSIGDSTSIPDIIIIG